MPDLAIVEAHGKMPAGEIDAVMVGFADGVGDVLLATNIIEAGLDAAACKHDEHLAGRPVRPCPASPAARPGGAAIGGQADHRSPTPSMRSASAP